MMHTFRTSQPDLAADPSRPHLILVGLPGSGKTTVGRAVAKQLGRAFLDLDAEIECREGLSIAQLFADKGEAYFRRRERELTEELTLVGNMIVAPGGGWVTHPEVVGIVRPPSRLVYLKVCPDTALERLGPMRRVRPLLSSPDPLAELERLFESRKEAYEAADNEVDTERYDLQGVIEEVLVLASLWG